MWTLQDLEDELDAGSDLLRRGDASADADRLAFHQRARRHFARARDMLGVVQYLDALAEADVSAAPVDGPPTDAKPVPTPEDPTPASQAFIVTPTDVAPALGGPYREHTLVIPRGYLRWVLKDVGGARVSVCATRDQSPSDAIAESELKGLVVEGYYRYGNCAHLWEPVVQLAPARVPQA